MILDFESICLPTQAYEKVLDAPLPLGAAGCLTVLHVTGGAATLPQGVSVPYGSVAVVGGAFLLQPQGGGCYITAVTLQGAAAQQAAAALGGPFLTTAAGCPGADELLLRIAAGCGRAAAAEQSSLCYSLLCRLAQAAESRSTVPPMVAAAIAHIQEHYADVYGVEELAAGLEVSKSHLIRSFTAAVGTPPGKYLTAVRVEAAKRLLLHEDYSLDIVASLCGFSGANYLCKVFKTHTGESPAAWRRRTAGPMAAGADNTLEEQMYL